MKKLLYFTFTLLLISSCSVNKKPVFVKVDNIKVLSFAMDTIRLKADAFFKNPNNVSGKIFTDEIKVIVNGTEVAQVSSDEFKVPSRKEFAIPLNVAIPSKKVFDDKKNGFLGGLLNSIIAKKVNVQFKGDLKYKVFGFSNTYVVDKTQEIKIKF